MARLKRFGKRRNISKTKTDASVVNNSVNSCSSSNSVNSSTSSKSFHSNKPMPVNEGRPSISSSSGKKLKNIKLCAEEAEYYGHHFKDGNVLVNIDILSKQLSKFAVCKQCFSELSLELFESTEKRKGIVSRLSLICNNCDANADFMTSEKTKSGYFENNIRLVYAMRSIGKGRSAAQTFCSVMNLPQPPLRFDSYNKELGICISEVAKESMEIAKREAVSENDGNSDLSVIFDGTWQKRGHSSLNGVVTVTSLDTSKVLDVECMSKYCNICKGKQVLSHEGCLANYKGTSGGMEINGVVKIYERSDKGNIPTRYVNYLGDGDSKAFEVVNNSKPYGPDITIQKLECIGHIQKRMGGRLRRLKEKYKGVTLPDGKPLSGKGRLTDNVITELQTYYGTAIRQNCDDVDKMKQAVWATFFHKLSTADKPQHGLCPAGTTSWCKYNRSKELNVEPPLPKNNIPSTIMEVIKPIYQDLANPILLKKCVHGKTQNQNESFNNMIWTRVSKNNFVGLETLKNGVYDAVICYNEGVLGKAKVMQKVCGKSGANCIVGLKRQDLKRVYEAEKAMKEIEKRAHAARLNVKRRLQDNEQVSDDPDYGYGAH